VTYVQVGGTPTRLVALQSGSVDAALQSPANLEIIKQLGMNVLIDLFEKRLPYCGSGIGATKSFMTAKPGRVEAFMRGMVKETAYTREGDGQTVKAIKSKYMKISVNDRALVDVYNFHSRQGNSKYPGIPREAVAFIIDEHATRDRSWQDWKPEHFYDSSVIDNLQKIGFLDDIYKQLK
jgi:ABC-type nitrate/sulfonate/bicarbonate transport system substrate-binding protein